MKTPNEEKLHAALALALADDKFMGNDTKVDNAVFALTPKSTVSATLKRLQGNANKDYLDKKDKGLAGYTDENRADKIKEYVHDKFKSYMVDAKTKVEAKKLFDAAYPAVTTTPTDMIPADGVADEGKQAA